MEKEGYNNIIELLKRTLQYYADEDNYLQRVDNVSGLHKINLDNGEQARATLKTVNELEKAIDTYEDDYEKLINSENFDTDSEMKNIIDNLKNMKNGD